MVTLRSLALRTRNAGVRALVEAWHVGRKRRVRLERLGSDYGGWYTPIDHLSERSICYCVGVGEDITFDLALIERFGCEVYAFDPTPRSAEYVERTVADKNPRYHFSPIGVWSRDEKVRLYAPRDPQHVSHSALNLQETSDYFDADCRRLGTIMRELGHERIDLLKLNVEGAEYPILHDMVNDRIPVGTLCVELHQPVPVANLFSTLRQLEAAGFRLANIESRNYTFIHDSVQD
jgi:FkbM family methyltransferase